MKKFLKRLLIGVTVVIALYFVLALFAPSNYKVERVREITASPEAVYAQLSSFQGWQGWSPWQERDPGMVNTLEGEDGTVGCTQHWKGDPDLSGEGQIKFTEFIENEKVGYELTFQESMVSNGAISIEATETGSKVHWQNAGEIPFIMRTAAWLFMDMDKMMGPDFERGLEKIDSLAMIKQQEMDAKAEYVISEVAFPTTFYYGIRYDTLISAVDSSLYAMTYGKLGAFCGTNHVTPAGPPVSINISWDHEKGRCVIMPAFPVAETGSSVGEIEFFTVDSCKAAVLDYYGDYGNMEAAYRQMGKYLQVHRFTSELSMEVYLTDPTTVEGMDQCLTKIYFFLK